MKALLNWRYYVIVALGVVGFLALLRAFGEPMVPMSFAEFLLHFILSVSISFGCFKALRVLVAKWKAQNKIPEYDKLL